jgi:hypothetical protein
LKRLLLILFTGLLISLGAQGQGGRGSNTDPGKLLKFYPNPATSYITFDLQKNYQKGLTISVFNFLGKKVSESPNVNERTTLQLADYSRGVYIYYLTDATGKVLDTGKFQVSK